MPSSQETSTNHPNPEVMSMMEKYRFKSNKLLGNQIAAEASNHNVFSHHEQTAPVLENIQTGKKPSWHSPEGPTPNGTSYIPETPEHLLKQSSELSENGYRDMAESPEPEVPVRSVKMSRVKRVILSDSESDSDEHGKLTKRAKIPSGDSSLSSESPSSTLNKRFLDPPAPGTFAAELLANDIFTDKELGLRIMMNTFPKMDLMRLQDILAKCEWYGKKAIHVIQEDCDPRTCTHIEKPRPVPAPEPESESQQPIFNLVPIAVVEPTSFFHTSPSHEAMIETNHSALSDNRVQCELNSNESTPDLIFNEISAANSVDSQEETAAPVRSTRPVRNRIHQLSSSDDDSDNEGGIKIISMGSLKQIKPPANLIQRNKTHMISSDDEQTNAPPPKSPSPKPKEKRKKKQKKKKDVEADDDEVDYAGDELYNSEDSDIDETLTPAREAVLNFYRKSSTPELLSVPGFSKKKVDSILVCRPFGSWLDLVQKLQSRKHLTTDMLSAVRDVIVTREVMSKLMQRCEKIALDMEKVVAQITTGSSKGKCIIEQPRLLTKSLQLAPYQLLGLNWLWVIHKRRLNGILADEMGLGKTIQAISFLAHLKEKEGPSKHLVIVPSSTLDNWVREFHVWCPSFNVIIYHGSQDVRREMRLQIINDEMEEFDVMMTTYNMVSSSPEDRTLFRRLDFHYVIFDEAHMLKNMNSQRYQNLMKIKTERRLLLTGTPLQNNLVELMSLLIFVMPEMFYDKIEQVKQMFTAACKSEDNRSAYEKERIEHAKRIMKPFVLRRLKSEVLKQLPTKYEEIHECFFTESQNALYSSLVAAFSERVTKEANLAVKSSGVGMMMELRKAANHPLLIRRKYSDATLRSMSKKMINEPTHVDANPNLIFEDMQVMSDFELHRLCKNFKSIASFQLPNEAILDSGKFSALDSMLPDMKENGSRFLLFSQFTMMLDVVEEYMAIRDYSFLRLDGSTPVTERQELMDRFNEDENIFAFLLSTKAGGLGINLTAANVVLLHDIDFNPYNDKQAEDRCHRLGQTREVTVKRMIMKGSIEEAILRCAQDKLKLEKDITDANGDDEEDVKTVGNLLKTALGL